MGVCLINDNFEDLRFDFYDKEREEEEKAKRAKQQYKKSQQVIKVDKFQLEKIKKQSY